VLVHVSVQQSSGLAFNVLLLGSCVLLRLPLSLLVEVLLTLVLRLLPTTTFHGLPLLLRAAGSWNSSVHHNKCVPDVFRMCLVFGDLQTLFEHSKHFSDTLQTLQTLFEHIANTLQTHCER